MTERMGLVKGKKYFAHRSRRKAGIRGYEDMTKVTLVGGADLAKNILLSTLEKVMGNGNVRNNLSSSHTLHSTQYER